MERMTSWSDPPGERPRRVMVEGVEPQVDGGRFPIKRTTGERITVQADIFADGHDRLAAVLRYRLAEAPCASADIPADLEWRETPMTPAGNDRWTAAFAVDTLGRWEYTIEAWIDRFASWREDLTKKYAAAVDVASELLEGAALIRRTAERLPPGTSAAGAAPGAREWLLGRALLLEGPDETDLKVAVALADRLAEEIGAHASRGSATRYDRVLSVVVERPRARFGAWYEFFPRSAGRDATRGATLVEAAERLPDIAAMGFDVIYLPPIHPIGRSFRKGPNNTLAAGASDPGSPWAIGAAEGGHDSVDPGLGSVEDFERFVAVARRFGLEVALDLALQASPDHPWVTEHPEWFHHRPDGTIKYAENPPKKYQDIYPIDFESPSGWQGLWRAIADVVVGWIERGVRIFRVDNPHTKPFPFWEWLIQDIRRRYPDVVFLAEAFTRPKPMLYLAKTGFSQSYTYFTWRNTKAEIAEYFNALAQGNIREYFRPNLFANTPDILPEFLQRGGKPAFKIRLVLAATLGANYGVYSGFELCENRGVPGTEEYLDSEKYEIRPRDWDRPGNIKEFVSRVNQVRRGNQALHADSSLRFHHTDNEQVICYSKTAAEPRNRILVVVNLDPFNRQDAWISVPIVEMDLAGHPSYQVRDLLTDEVFTWHGDWNFVRLEPDVRPAHILRIEET
jgi:starch synthase (maltosyl-transferring)